MKKKVLSLVLSASMVSSMLPAMAYAADGTTTFPDMPNDWSTTALQSAIDNGLLNGIDGKIAASENLTRAQMAAIVTRAFGTNGNADISGFGDVNSGDWFYNAMAAAVNMGAFQGDGTGLNPNANITRQEAFTVLARLFTLSGADQSVLNSFSDAGQVADWAKDSMASMVQAGYVSGDRNMLKPTSSITRAEFAQVMYNLLSDYMVAGEDGTNVQGNAILNQTGTLSNVTVSGDLIIGDGAGEGDVTLNNVTVSGRLLVRGGGVNTVTLEGNTTVGGQIVVNKPTGDVRVHNSTSNEFDAAVISDGATLTGEFDVVEVTASGTTTVTGATVNTVNVSAAASLSVTGESKVDTVNLDAASSKLNVNGNSTVTTVNVPESASNASIDVANGSTVTNVNTAANGVSIDGEGKVSNVKVEGNNTSVDTVGTKVTVASGVTGTTSNGKDIAAGTTVTTTANGTTGGGSTGGSSDTGDTGETPVEPATTTVTVRPIGPAVGADGPVDSYDYAANYEEAGVTVTNGTDQNDNTVTINVDATKVTTATIDYEMVHDINGEEEGGTYAFIGLQFNAPEGATSVKIDNAQDSVSLAQDSADGSIFGGNVIEYYNIADVTVDEGNAITDVKVRSNASWTKTLVWYNETGTPISTTTYTINREVTGATYSYQEGDTTYVSTGDLADSITNNVTLLTNISLTKDVTIGADGSLTVGEGVTLTVTDQGSLTIAENGNYAVNGTITVQDGGTLTDNRTNNAMSGTGSLVYEAGAIGKLGATTFIGTDDAIVNLAEGTITLKTIVAGEPNMILDEAAVATINTGKTLGITNNQYAEINGSLTVPEGATLTVEAGSQVKVNGTLDASNGTVSGTIVKGTDGVVNLPADGSGVTVVDPVTDTATLKAALDNLSTVELASDVALTENITIGNDKTLIVPANMNLNIQEPAVETQIATMSEDQQTAAVTLTVEKGGKLIVEGTITVAENTAVANSGAIEVAESAQLKNNGAVTVNSGATVINNGTMEVSKDATMDVAEDASVTNEGTLTNDGITTGNVVNNGQVSGKTTIDRTINEANLHDTSETIADGKGHLFESYDATAKKDLSNNTTTIIITAEGLKKHWNGDTPQNLGYWVGAFLPAPEGTEWSKVKYRKGTKGEFTGGLTSAGLKDDNGEYLSYYVNADGTAETFDFYVAWDGNTENAEHFVLNVKDVKTADWSVEELLKMANYFKWDDDHKNVGKTTIEDTTINYSAAAQDFADPSGDDGHTKATADLARYLGALYHVDNTVTINYNDTAYIWKADFGLKGSNWVKEADSSTTLVSQIVNEIAQDMNLGGDKQAPVADDTAEITLTINGKPVTINITVAADTGVGA